MTTVPSAATTSSMKQRPTRFGRDRPVRGMIGWGTPSVVPQSSSRTMTSWATSTRRRVRYPESDVRRAVSARTLTSAVRGDKVLERQQALAEVRLNGKVDRLAGHVCHQATHAGELTQLGLGATGTGVGHHVQRVLLVEHGHGILDADLVGRGVPDVDDLDMALHLGLMKPSRSLVDRSTLLWARSRTSPLVGGMRASHTGDGEPARVVA